MKTKLLISLMLVFLVHSFGFAQSNEWTGNVSTVWNVAGNWSLGHVPTNIEDVQIYNKTNRPEISVGFAAVCKSMKVNNYSSLTQADVLTIYGSLNVTGDITIDGGNNLYGSMIVVNGLLEAANLHYQGGNTSSPAKLEINNGGVVTVKDKITTYAGSGFLNFNSGSGVLNIGSSFEGITANNLVNFTKGTGTVNYTNSGNQNIAQFDYFNLILSGGGIKSFPTTALGIANRLTIGPSVQANLGTITHTARRLTLGTNSQTSNATYGSTSSSATYKNNTYFIVTIGMLNITDNSCVGLTSQNVTGSGGNYCSNATIPSTIIGLASSQSGISYQLVRGTTNVGTAILGTGNAINFPGDNVSGIYTVLASSPYCSPATLGMTGNVIINTYDAPPIPTASKTADANCFTKIGTITVNTPTPLSPSSLTFWGGNYVNTNVSLLNNLTSFTMEGWVKFNITDVTNKRMGLFGQNDLIELGIINNNINFWANSVGIGGGSLDFPLASYPTDGSWHHIAAIGNGASLTLYLDGISVKTVVAQINTNYGTNAEKITIGAGLLTTGGGTDVGLTGQILKVGFWNRALSLTELAGLAGGFIKYNANQTGLLSGYNFATGTGTSLTAVGSATAAGTLTQGAGAAIPAWTDPYTYAWTGPNGFTSSAKNLTQLAFGNYSLTTSLKNCSTTIASPVNVAYPVTTKTWTTTNQWTNNANANDHTIPTADDNLIFAGNYDPSTPVDLSGCSCTVNSGAIVVKGGKTMTIVNEVKVNGGSLTFEDKSSLVQINNTPAIANSGNIVYKRIANMQKFDYTFWASPVVNAIPITLKSFSPNTVSSGYQVNSAGAWSFTNGTTIMEPGMGYAIMAPSTFTPTNADFTGSFTGVPNNGNVQITPTGLWKLVGNPYPSALDVDKFIQGNPTLYGTVYFWAHTSRPISTNPGSYAFNYASTDYAIYNFTGGISTGANTAGAVGYVGAGQSFFISGWSNDPILFKNEMRIGGANNGMFYRTSPKAKTAATDDTKLWLNLTNEQGLFKQILIGYVNGATDNYDSLYDGVSFNANSYANFYSLNDGADLAIQGRALPFKESDEVPLGFMVNLAKDPAVKNPFTISIDHTEGSLSNQAIYLLDKETNSTYDLSQKAYDFTSFDGTFNDRFILKYTNSSLGIGDFENTSKELTVAVKNKMITIDAKAKIIVKVMVYDISGKTIYNKDKINNSTFIISNLRNSEGILVIKIILENGEVQSRKLLFE